MARKSWKPHDAAPAQPGEPTGFPVDHPFERHQEELDLAREGSQTGRRPRARRNTGPAPDPALANPRQARRSESSE